MAVICKHKSNVIDDCTVTCTKVIVFSDTFEELKKLIYYL